MMNVHKHFINARGFLGLGRVLLDPFGRFAAGTREERAIILNSLYI